MEHDDIVLTDRELMIAQRAAEMAVKKMQDEFYRQLGKGVVNKLFVVIGMLVVALYTWAAAKGWIGPGK